MRAFHQAAWSSLASVVHSSSAVARDLPFLPGLAECRVQIVAEGLESFLVPLPDDVDLGIVGDLLQGDVGDSLVDESLTDATVGGLVGRDPARDLGFLLLAFAAVGEEVVGVAGAHDAGAGQRESDAGGVDGDPPAAPLLGDEGGGAGTAGGVEDEVAWVGGHEDAALDDRC